VHGKALSMLMLTYQTFGFTITPEVWITTTGGTASVQASWFSIATVQIIYTIEQ